MEYKEVLERLSVCGMDCSRCADYDNGTIRVISIKLLELLNGYHRLAKMKVDINPIFNEYPKFQEILSLFAEGNCSGCRSENVKCPITCHAKTCCKEKEIDFCFQCSEFPCSQQFEGKLRERWIEKNNRMKEIGVEGFYEEQSKLPRY